MQFVRTVYGVQVGTKSLNQTCLPAFCSLRLCKIARITPYTDVCHLNLICILEVPVLNPDHDIDYPEVFLGSPQSL